MQWVFWKSGRLGEVVALAKVIETTVLFQMVRKKETGNPAQQAGTTVF